MNSGVHSYPDGSCYEGQWLNGRRHGHGAWTKADGSMYVGEWVNDKPHGQGTLTLPNGNKYSGEWKEGRRHGSGVKIHPDGTKCFGEWENGKLLAERRPITEHNKQYLEPEIIKHDYRDEPVEIKRRQTDQTQYGSQTDPPSAIEKYHFISSKSKQSQRKLSRNKSKVWSVLLIFTILGLAAIAFILTGGEETYVASGQVVNYEGEGIAGVIIDFGEKFEATNTDENGYWFKSNLQGQVTVTPQFGNFLFNPIRTEISKAEEEINFTLQKEVDKGVTSSAGEYVFSSHLTAAEEVEITIIVDDYESGEKLEGIDVEVVVGGDTIEIFLQDDEGFYLPTIIVLEMERLEDYPGVEVKSGSLLVTIRTKLLSNNYLQWAIQNPREASADVALSIAVGLDVAGLATYAAGGIVIMTAPATGPATAGASAVFGAGAIAAGFAMTTVSEFLKVYAADVYSGIEKTEYSATIYIYESHESATHAKLLVPAGTSIDEIIKAVESEIGDREYEIIAPETNPAGAYYNNDGTPKFFKVFLKEHQIAAMQISNLEIGDRVVDNSWQWEFRTGDDYTYQPGDITKPVVWIVVAKDHYGVGNGVTLLSEELIGKFPFDNSTDIEGEFGSSHWGQSGTGKATRGLRPWLNSTGHHQDVGFYRAFSEDFKRAILTTTLSNREWLNGNYYTTSDKVFVPSTTELGEINHDWTYEIGITFPYFINANDSDRIALLGGMQNWYWTLSPNPSWLGSALRGIHHDGGTFYSRDCAAHAYVNNIGVRPAINLSSETEVSKIPNAAGVYEVVYVKENSIKPTEINMEEFYVVNVDTGSNLFIRKSPGTKNKPGDDIVGRVPRGRILEVINKHDNTIVVDNYTWWEVKDQLTGLSGWVASEYLEVVTGARVDMKEPYSGKEFGLESIGLSAGMSAEEVIRILGEPLGIERDEDGMYGSSTEMTYDGLILGFHQGFHDSPEPTDSYLYFYELSSPQIVGKRGIRVGDTAESVLEKYYKEYEKESANPFDGSVTVELYYIEIDVDTVMSGEYTINHNTEEILEIYYWYGIPDSCGGVSVNYAIENGLVKLIRLYLN